MTHTVHVVIKNKNFMFVLKDFKAVVEFTSEFNKKFGGTEDFESTWIVAVYSGAPVVAHSSFKKRDGIMDLRGVKNLRSLL